MAPSSSVTGSGPGPPEPITEPSSVQAILQTTLRPEIDESDVMISLAVTSRPLKITSPIL